MLYGLDIGGTKIEIAVYDARLAAVARWRAATPTRDYGAFLDILVQLVKAADEKYGCTGQVGIGLPGLIDAGGRSLCSNIPAANGQNIVKDLSTRLGRPISCENDCRCFALSEATGGAGEGYRTVYGAVLGTGAAGGFVVDGRLERGRQGIAGEYGHQQLPAFLQQKYQLPLRQCGCGLPSCFEAYISGPGLLFLHRHFGGACDAAPDLAHLWRRGDTNAKTTFACYLDLLGACFATLVLAHDPDVIVLGGGVSLIPEITEKLPQAMKAHLFAGCTVPPIVAAHFGDTSGGRGAAILASHAFDG